MISHFIRPFPFCLLFSILPVVFSDTSLAAENTPEHCAPTYNAVAKKMPLNPISVDDSAIYLSADSVVSKQSNQFDVDGNVSIQTNQHSIQADKAQYNRQQHYLSAQGNITYWDNSLFIESDKLNLDLKSNAGDAKNTRYHLLEPNTNGIAGQISFKNSQLKLQDSTYSTCIEDKVGDRKAWQIRAKSIELNPQKNEGIARNMWLEIANVPVLYLPYVSFPIEGRKSGFLAPRPSYSSNEGFDVAIPYYFNLKPNYDLTFTPRIINKRGAQVAGEFRYLQENSNGIVGLEILPDDKQTQTNRTHFRLKHHSQLNNSTNYDIEYAQVTDKQYFSDLGTELNSVNTTALSRGFRSETQGQNWLFNSVIQDYQILDNNPEPYRRIPQLNLDTLGKFGAIQWRNLAQYTYFQKSSQDYIHRAVVEPYFSVPLKRQYGYFIPSVKLYASYYQLLKGEQALSKETSDHFLNWQFSSKTGLYFERTTAVIYQTLTPELQYTYIPYKSQSHLPLIDSDLINYDINHLFTSNRYSGYDRLGDENRLSWSLSTDYIRLKTNKSLFYAQFAQAIYLADHQSLLAGEKAVQKNDVVNAAMIKGRVSSRITAKTQAYHFAGESRLNNGNMSLNYKNDHEQLELAYRFRDQLVEQLSIIGILDISSQWRVATRWLYSLNNERTREALLGLEYNSCCWAIRLMGRQYASQESTELNTSVGLQIELKGLTRIGSSLDKQFSDEVFGNQ